MGESITEDALDAQAGSAVDDGYTYFELTADLRKCPSPLCGGWFVKRLNRSTTKCHDGRLAQVCYAPVLDWSEVNLSEEQRAKLLDASSTGAVSEGVFAIARGRFEATNATPRPELGRLVISEAWVAEGDAVSNGVFVQIKDNGLRCFVAPCPNLTEQTLNMPRSADIAEVDWTPAELSAPQLEVCIEAMHSAEGILIAGDRYMEYQNGSPAKGRTATAAYRRLSDAEE